MNKIFDNKHYAKEEELLIKFITEEGLNDAEDINIIKTLGDVIVKINNSKNPQAVLTYLTNYYKNGLLTPLTLKNNEFHKINKNNIKYNKRCSLIYKTSDNDICYKNSYRPFITHAYNIDTNEEVPVFPDILEYNNLDILPIWITKGGCCTGDCITRISLKQSTIDKHYFYPHNPIVIPITFEFNKEGFTRLSVDIREPKLKSLREFYNVIETKTDNKFDIRKYKKLNKNGNSKR